MKYVSKADLIVDIRIEHAALCSLIDDVGETRRTEQGVWGDGWSLHDLVAHLAEWHTMLLRWFSEGRLGGSPALPAPGYKWNQTPQLNREIWRKHHNRSWQAVWADFAATYDRVVALVESLSEDDLLQPGRFPWTGKLPLASYIGPNTASHYRFAKKVIKRWRKSETRVRRGTA